MTPKQFLRQYRDLEISIQSKSRKIRKLRFATKNQKDEEVQKALLRLKNALISEVNKLIDIQFNIYLEINGLNNLIYSNILEMRYIEGLSFGKIAHILNYSYDYVLKMHGKALEEIKKRLKEGRKVQVF